MKLFLYLLRPAIGALVASAAVAGWLALEPGWAAEAAFASDLTAWPSRFVDVTESSGVGDAIRRHYEQYPQWWLSGVNLVDLDGDGHLDLFFAAHGAGRSLAMLGDGHGHFKVAEGSYPPSEIHLPYDINEDGKLDLQMTWQDGGGRWWINESTPGRLSFRESTITAGQARISAMIDLNRDGKVDWLHERPGVVFELGDGQGGFKIGGHLEIAPTRNEINIYPADLNGDGYIDLAVQWGREADVSVEFYPSGKQIVSRGVKANTTLMVSEAGQVSQNQQAVTESIPLHAVP